ncbi:hypothetical protein CDES_05610 [Corynebacterium deserti GIMN1.010]|uniref:Uncharacterized protein n=1 Tax=Corynebacterium deserti GIMN1.010 TaxID=931089 RepID=A0A0M5IU56_9CORY|nr:hypothetical protein [Corynebacterium deserti]ALC05556.1 hypothetical protein CDES_05610 [Corynebacterium deserti GIMN1.010]
MGKGNYGFFFEKSGRSRAYGATSSDEEHFKGTTIAEALVRELGQNSLDAVDSGSECVRLEFELASVNSSDIPDVENLKAHILAAHETTQSIDARNTRLKDAAESIQRDSMMVLRVGDYGTKGLTGSERQSAKGTPLSALTRGAGISAGKDGGGGSFGVGSSVGTLASDVHTVFWTSLPKGEREVVFAGYSQLATHRLPGGEDLVPDGFFLNLDRKDDFEYLRSPGSIGPFKQREEQGTDVFILGYADAVNDPGLVALRSEVIKNFLVAIHRGKLVVTGKTPLGNWILDKESLQGYVENLDDVYPFYRAILDPEPYVEHLKGLGEVKLFIKVDDGFGKKRDTIGIRKPLMKVAVFRHTSISMKYAAIMECSNDEGNQTLRALESPRHDKWEPSRDKGGTATLKRIKDFIRRGLMSRMEETIGDEVEIKGLEKYLPTFIDSEHLGRKEAKTRGKPKNGEGVDKESASMQGQPTIEDKPTPIKTRKSVKVQIQKRGESGDDAEGMKGKMSGGSSKRKSKGGDLPGGVSEGDGSAKLPGGSIRSRAWFTQQNGKGLLNLHLSSDSPLEGSINLRALGPGGEIDDTFVLPISRVAQRLEQGEKVLEFSGNIINGVQLNGKPASARIVIEFSENRRFAVAVV